MIFCCLKFEFSFLQSSIYKDSSLFWERYTEPFAPSHIIELDKTVDVHIQLAKLNYINKQCCHGNETSFYILYKHLTLGELLKQLEGKKVCIKEKQVAKVMTLGRSRHHREQTGSFELTN